MEKQKRHSRTYKATDAVYTKAMKRAKRCKVNLANIIELFVSDYGEGLHGSYNEFAPPIKKK